MRILIATSTFPVALSEGGPRFVFDLAKSLTAYGTVEVLAPHAPGAEHTETWDSVRIRRFRYFWPTRIQRLAYGGGMRENMRASWLAVLQVPFLLAIQVWTVWRLTRRGQVDVVNSHWLVPQGLTTALARGRRAPFRHVLHVHAADVYLLAKLPFGGQIARFVLARSDAVLADGSHVRDALDDLAGFPSGAVLQPMGAWVEQFQADVEPLATKLRPGHLAFVGRLVEKKGVVHLIRAMAAVREHAPQLGLLIIGDGPLRSDLEAEVRRLGLTDVVEFAGARSHDEVVRYLGQAGLAVVPSIIDSRGETEGMPTVVVEMMAAGLPVVGSRVNGIPDVIEHGKNGWLAEPGNPADLAEKILTGLADSKAGASEAALASARAMDWTEVARTYAGYLAATGEHAQ